MNKKNPSGNSGKIKTIHKNYYFHGHQLRHTFAYSAYYYFDCSIEQLREFFGYEINNISNNITISKVTALNELNTKHISQLQNLTNKSQNRYEDFLINNKIKKVIK